MVVIDDGSGDATTSVATQAGAIAIRLPFNTGVGGAVRTGLRYAEDHGYERAVVIDADGQHDPAGIAVLLAGLDRGNDLVLGSRFADPASDYRVGGLRRRAMRLLAWLVRRITGMRLTDVTSGYRAFSRRAIQVLAREFPSEYLADTVEVLLIAHAATLKIEEVPVPMRVRAGGVPSTRNVRLALNYLRLLVEIAAGGYRHVRTIPEEAS